MAAVNETNQIVYILKKVTPGDHSISWGYKFFVSKKVRVSWEGPILPFYLSSFAPPWKDNERFFFSPSGG